MSDGLEQVPKTGFTTKSTSFSPQRSFFSTDSDTIKNSLSISRHPPEKAQAYQETANASFETIDKDYKQAKFNNYKLKGLVSGRLEGFPVILWDLKAFIKWVKAEAKRVAFEVSITRRNQYQEDQWSKAKKAFQAELDRLNQQRQRP